jgi:hypothetical protein
VAPNALELKWRISEMSPAAAKLEFGKYHYQPEKSDLSSPSQ